MDGNWVRKLNIMVNVENSSCVYFFRLYCFQLIPIKDTEAQNART